MQGYYSLIQYCPDFTRLEVCNLGVMIYCPEPRFLDVRMTKKIGRIHTIFGKEHDLGYVKTFRDSFANRIRDEWQYLNGLDGLKAFIARRANYFRITEPRSMLVTNPKVDLDNMFAEIFGEAVQAAPIKRDSTRERFYEKLQQCFGDKLENHVITRCPQIAIPDFHRVIRPSACYLNGVFNIVVQRQLNPEDALQKLGIDMATGKILAGRKDERWGEQRLVILADTGQKDEVEKQVETFEPMLRENKVEIFTNVEDIAAKIRKEAKELTPDLYNMATKS